MSELFVPSWNFFPSFLMQDIDIMHCVLYAFRLASVEALSGHPLARAVVSYARMQGVEASKEVSDFEILPGEGVTAVVEGRRVHVGNRRAAERFEWMAG